MSTPPNFTAPSRGWYSPISILPSVDLPDPIRPDDADLLAGLDEHGNVREGQTFGAGVGKRQILKRERGVQLAELHVLVVVLAFGGKLHSRSSAAGTCGNFAVW